MSLGEELSGSTKLKKKKKKKRYGTCAKAAKIKVQSSNFVILGTT